MSKSPGSLTSRPVHRNRFALRLFDGVAESYEWPARAYSLFQYDLWHRHLVSRLTLTPEARVLDVCTGTALVATRIARRAGCDVVGLDLSGPMLSRARRRLDAEGVASSVGLVRGRAECLPFADDSFDAVVFTFLLRYVDDVQGTLFELSRVLRPGGQLASLEFYVPESPPVRALWLLHTRIVMPATTRLLSEGWREVGSFLGPSISSFYREHTLDDLTRMWGQAGVGDVQTNALSLGGAVVMWGRKEALR